MRHLLHNRYAFIIVGESGAGKSAMMSKLCEFKVMYTSRARLELDHNIKEAKLISSYPNHVNLICCSRSFKCEQEPHAIESLEERLENIDYQFVLVPEQPACLPELVNKLSSNNFNITCYHIKVERNEAKEIIKRTITINDEKPDLGDIKSQEYNDIIAEIKKDMYKKIMPI